MCVCVCVYIYIYIYIYIHIHILPREPQGRLGSYKLLNTTAHCELGHSGNGVCIFSRLFGCCRLCCFATDDPYPFIQGVPLATEPGIFLIILPLMRILLRNLKRTTNTFLLYISLTTNILLFRFLCSILTH